MKTRKHILDATEQVIQERGAGRVTTKEIARTAGVAEGTLFKHFDRKEELLLAVIREHAPQFAAILRPEQAGTGTLREQLETIAQAAIDYYSKLIPLAIAICADTAILERQRDWIEANQAGPRKLFEVVAAYITAEQHLGRIKSQSDPMSVAALLLGPCHQYAFMRYYLGKNPFPTTDQQFNTGLVQTLLEGLTRPVGNESGQ